ncbi:MAG: low molecular weight protein tyrosine phosphatase family protein [Terracidiphilus sp.]
MKLLFVCSRNRLRSPTAEAVFSAYDGIEALSAGTSPDAENPVSTELIEWADLVFAMESVHRRRLQKQFGSRLRAKRVVVLGIPDNYKYMEPELVRILEGAVAPYLTGKSASSI